MTVTPLIFNLGPTELIIILVIVLLLFGGSRLAGLGKSTGRALKEFKEETKGLTGGDKDKTDDVPPAAPQVAQPPASQPPQSGGSAQPPQGQWQQPPTQNLADPSTNDVRKDV